ncbi:sugar transporter [Sphingomonas montanisoli]|uniref:Sugar transporter n=1 Tax=Sphingomonas montanisoli TaxID=2606412 RepID=A0A5D9C013_9SPHN|nr:sugar transporter [Sphingomonas montanisoli]TZG25009.1 sugar transporter [Sphingomonas montanisoli]
MAKRAVPTWFWIVAVLLLLWDAMGVAAFCMQYMMGPEQLAQLPPDQREAFSSMPSWAWAAYGVGTIGGVIGSLLLLLRTKLALPLYLISLIAVLAQFGWTFFGYGMIHHSDVAMKAIFPAVIIALCIFQLWFANLAIRRGWIS